MSCGGLIRNCTGFFEFSKSNSVKFKENLIMTFPKGHYAFTLDDYSSRGKTTTSFSGYSERKEEKKKEVFSLKFNRDLQEILLGRIVQFQIKVPIKAFTRRVLWWTDLNEFWLF